MSGELKPNADLPHVVLVNGDAYWIKKAYADEDLWTIAKWEHGCWWDIDGRETTPRVICGPIPRPSPPVVEGPKPIIARPDTPD